MPARKCAIPAMLLLFTLLAACGSAEPTTLVSATYTPVVSETPAPPTATPVPPTATPVSPTATVPPSATPRPLTSTPRPPTETATPIAPSTFDGVRVTYVNNSGFLITVGDKRILIDALYEGYAGGILKPVVDAQPPFDGVDVILATHGHLDHFSPSLVLEYMKDNPRTTFISTQGAADQLLALDDSIQDRVVPVQLKPGESRQIVVNDIAVEALHISHGEPGLLNLGFVITVGQTTFFHTGDIVPDEVPLAYLQSYGLREKQIDVQFVPAFFMVPGEYRPYLWEEVQATYLVPMHYDYYQPPLELERSFPNAIVFHDTLESRAVPVTTEALPAITAQPSASGDDGGLIAFVSTRDGNGEIYVMNADGSDQRRLTDYRQWDGFPDWSPDGSRIAYYSYLSAKDWVIKVMDADGGNPRQVTEGGACDGAPFWSPDGTRIAYTSAADCIPTHRDVYVIGAGGGSPVNLTQHPADDNGSSWSPDSTQIVFSSNRDGNYELYVMDAEGSNVRRLTDDPAADLAPAWSPDGTEIAFYSERDGNAEIYVMASDGSDLRRLTDNPTEDWFPRWSPDGSQITFSSRRGGNLDIYVMNSDGSNVRRLTDSPREDFNSVWQPGPHTWVRSYRGEPRWAALDGLVTPDGGFLLVGASNYSHQNAPREDIYLVKTDAAGEIAWSRAYGGDGFDRGNAVIEATGGGFIILGETASTGAGDWDMYLLRVDEEGHEIWSRTYGGPGKERANAIRQTADGGYILAGQTASLGAGGADLYLVKTDDQGVEAWSQTYGGDYDEEGYDVRQAADGGFLVLAQVLQGDAVYVEQKPDTFLVMTDSAGRELWSQVWATEDADGGHVLLPTSDGDYLVAGITAPAGNQTQIDLLLVKIDFEGNQIWSKALGERDAVEYGTDALELPDGGYLLTGLYKRSGTGAIPLMRTDATGEVVWTRNLVEGRGNKVGMRLLPTPDGGYLIVGTTDEFGRGFETILVKTDADGNVTE